MPDSTATRVAIVDDDLTYGRAAARLFRASGIEALTFTSAEEFLAAGPSGRVDCLLLDVHLGGMSGFDLQERLASAGALPPIVFISGHTEPGIPARAAEAGCPFVRKSEPGDVLLGAVIRAVSGATRSHRSPVGPADRPHAAG